MSHAIFVRSLTAGEKTAVARLIRKAPDSRQMRRAQMIRLSAQGKTAGDIAVLLGFCIATVLRVIREFDRTGLASFSDQPRSGRPPRATDKYVKCLKQAVSRSPRDLGYGFTTWTLDRLREHLGRRCGVLLNSSYLARFMAKHDIVYRRPKHIMGHLQNPKEYREKKEVLAFLKKTRCGPTPASISSSSTSVRFTSTRR